MSANDKADAAWDDYVSQQQEEKIEKLECELNAANQIAKKYEDRYFAALDHINRLVLAGDALLSHSHCTNYHEKVAEWNEAKRIKL